MNTEQERLQAALLLLRPGSPQEQADAVRRLVAIEEPSALQALLQVLRSTEDSSLRNAIALELSDRGAPELFPVLVELLQDERTARSRGTLLYALVPYDCTPILPLLVDLFVTGGFEVRREAFNRLMETDTDLSHDEWKGLVDRLRSLDQRALPEPADFEVLEQLFDALNVDADQR